MEYLDQLKHEKKQYNHRIDRKIKAEIKALNKRIRHNYRHLFTRMEIFMVAMVIMNIGAMVITNALVVREKPGIEFREANTIQADMNDYVKHPEGNKLILGMTFQAFMYAVYFFVYMLQKYTVVSKVNLYVLYLFILFDGFLLGIDFFNDFGYLMGVVVYG